MHRAHLHVLHNQLACGTHAQGLGLCNGHIHAAQHGQHEACGLPTAIVGLGYQIPKGWVQDHGQSLCLDSGWPLKLHLIVQPLYTENV